MRRCAAVLCLVALVAPACMAAQVASIQSGTATSTANGTLTVNISAVDPAAAFLVFQARHSSNTPDDSTIRGELASATSLEFTRVSNGTNPIDVSWYVVEYASGVSVQRGTTVQSSNRIDVTLATAVASLGQAFVLHSKTAAAGNTSYSSDDPVTVRLRQTNRLRIESGTANSGHVIAWQVVEYTDPADITVYRGFTQLTRNNRVTVTRNIGARIDPARTLVLSSYRSDNDGADIDERTMRAWLPNDSQISFERGDTGDDDLDQITWQVIEFNDGTTVQSGAATLTGGSAVHNQSVSNVDPAFAVPLTTVQAFGGQAMGNTVFDNDDIVGVTSFTTLLTSATNLELRRSHSGDNSTVNWQILDFSAVMGAVVPPTPVAYFAMDASGWSGTGDVIDGSGNGNDGNPLGGADTVAGGYLCRGGDVPSNTSDALQEGVDTGLDVDDDIGSRGTISLWYRSNTVWNGGPERALFDAAQGNKYFDAMVDSAGRVTFNLEDTVDADIQFRTGPQAWVAGDWVHLAWTWDLPANSYHIYINGVLAASNSGTTNNTLGELDTLYLGDNRTTYHPLGTANSADGTIDEVRIYSSVLTATAIAADRDATHICPASAVDHFDIDHDGAGISCLAEAVSVTAEDAVGAAVTDYAEGVTLDTGTGKGTWTLTTGNGSFTDASANDGVATYSFATSDNGVATFALSYTEGASPVNLTVSQTAAPGITDDDTEGVLPFAPSGFTLTQLALATPPPNPTGPDLSNVTAGDVFTVHVTAYGQTATDPVCGIIESYTGARNLDAWVSYDNPGSGTLVPTLNGAAAGASEAAATSHAVTFSSGRASFNAAYRDVGSIRLNLRDAAETPAITGATNNFIASPADFVVQSIAGNPGTTSATGPGFVAAGVAFPVTVHVVNSVGGLTPNYGNESPAEQIRLRPVLVNPVTGAAGTIGNDTSLTGSGGIYSGSTLHWSEAGSIRLQAGVADSQYLTATDVVGAASGVVGRFYPAAFEMVSGSVTAGCGFVYAGQSALSVAYRIEARNVQGSVTTNYDAVLLAGGVGALNFHAENADSGVDLGARLAGLADQWRNGVYEVNTSLGSFTRLAAPDGPFLALQLGVSLQGVLDGQTITARDQNPDTSGDCAGAANCTSRTVGGTTDVRHGRIRVAEAFGPETEPLDMTLLAEFWEGTRFALNNLDNCSTFTGTAVSLGNYTGGLPAVTVVSPLTSTVLSSGRNPTGTPLLLSAPGAGNTGTVDVTLGVPAWLQHNWSGSGDENPTGTAMYGRFRGHDNVIYWREVTN